MDGFVAIAKATRVFGNGGELVLGLYDTFPEDINREEPVWIVIDSLPVPFFIERIERRGQKGALAVFSDIDTPERARALLGSEILTRLPETEDDDEMYMEELQGFRALIHIEAEPTGKNAAEGSKTPLQGTVTAFYDSEFNPLFEIECGGRTMLVPAVEPFILSIDSDDRTVEFSIPADLADLN